MDGVLVYTNCHKVAVWGWGGGWLDDGVDGLVE